MLNTTMTVKDLANYLHCCPSTIYRLVERRDIPGFRVGRRWRFKIDEIERWCGRRTIVEAARPLLGTRVRPNSASPSAGGLTKMG